MVKVSVSSEINSQRLESKNNVISYLSLGNYLNFYFPDIISTTSGYSFDSNSTITVGFDKENDISKTLSFMVNNHSELGPYIGKFLNYEIYINGLKNTEDVLFVSPIEFEIEFSNYGNYNIFVVAIGEDNTFSQSVRKTVKIESS